MGQVEIHTLIEEQGRLFAVQQLCDKTGSLEGSVVRVQRGRMKVSGIPATVTRGTTVKRALNSVDADTGAPVWAQLFVNDQPVGGTNGPACIAVYSPKLGEANERGLLEAGPA